MQSLRNNKFPLCFSFQLIATFFSYFFINFLSPRFIWINEHAHAAIESFGVLVAIITSIMLLHRKYEEGGGRLFWPANGLLSMGLLHGFHSIASPGHGFVLLYSAGCLSGSFFFALVWLHESDSYSNVRKWTPWIVASCSMLFGVSALLFSKTLPSMVFDREFTLTANFANILAGMLFIVSTGRFLLDFHLSDKTESLIFSCMALLFGLASLSFPFSTLWDSTWWFWHLLRVLAFLFVLWFILNKDLQTISALKSTIEEREQAETIMQETRGYLENLINYASAPIVVWDPSFKITRFNHAFEHLTGYTDFEVIGQELTLLFPETSRNESMGKIANTLSGEYWSSVEIPILCKDGNIKTVLWNSANIYANDNRTLLATIAQGIDITERLKAEQTLKETRDYLENLLNYANAPIIVWDPFYRITRFNHAFEHLSGYIENEVIGKELHILFSKESREESMNKIIKTASGEYWESVEIPILRNDGDIRIALWNSANIYAEDGTTLLATIAQGQDITERKATEASLQESEEKYRTMIEYSNDLIWTLDRDGNFTFFNKKAEEVSGYKLADWLGKSFAPLIPPEDLPGIMEIFTETLNGKSQRYEIDFYKIDGSICSLSVNTSPVIKSGEVVATVSFGQDVTDQKQAESFIKNILESVDEGFVVINREYRIISSNRVYSDMVKQPAEDIIGRHCYRVSHHRNRPCYEEGEDCAVRHTFETGISSRALHTHYDKEGTPFYVEMKSFPMKDERGRITSVIEIVNDITEKIKLEEQLRHSQKMEAIGTLAGGIAHDFNNILNVIIGYGELINKNMTADDMSRPQLAEILNAADRATHLTQRLLFFSRKQMTELKPLNINDIIIGFKKMFGRLIGEDIKLSLILYSPEVPFDKRQNTKDLTIMADRVQLEQILMNLATNARDAMPNGGTFTISTELVELDSEFIIAHGYGEPGMYALVTISDTGIGMDEKTATKIFEPFFTTKKFGKGTGLGLSIVYGIVKQHKGYIHVHSDPGKGTTFKIYLPAVKSEVFATQPTTLPEITGGTETILMAEDEESVRKITSTILLKYGYDVIETVDGDDALKKFIDSRDRIQLVILDVIMPSRNGKEAYEEMRRIRPDIKTIFMSGYMGDILDKKGIIENGMDFIAKPVSPNQLLKKVREVLDR